MPADRPPRRAGGTTPRRANVPDVHHRLIRRAYTLLGDTDFLEALEQERKAWTQVFRDYPLGDLGPPPEWALLSDDEYLIPERVGNESHAMVDDDWRDINTRVTLRNWKNKVDAIAHTWWPPEIYPARRWQLPARRFVAACLRWGTTDLRPEAWFAPANTPSVPIKPFRIYFDANDLAAPDVGNPEAVYWETMLHETLRALHHALDTGEAVTDATIRHAMQAADQVAEQRRAEAMAPGREHLVLPLNPDITSGAWKTTIWKRVKNELDAGGHPLHRYVRQQRDLGETHEDIADRIGVDRGTVSNWLGRVNRKTARGRVKRTRSPGRT